MDKQSKIKTLVKVIADSTLVEDWMKLLKIEKTNDVNYFVGNLIKLDSSNRNMDYIPKAEAKKSLSTQKYKMIAVSHWGNIIGSVVDAKIIEFNGDSFVQILGIIYTEKASAIFDSDVLSEILSGSYDLSMETFFEEVECSKCGYTGAACSAYCDCLNKRHEGSGASRILKGLVFSGGVFTYWPAEEDAHVLSIAEKQKGGNDEMKVIANEGEQKNPSTDVNIKISSDVSETNDAKEYGKQIDDLKSQAEEEQKARELAEAKAIEAEKKAKEAEEKLLTMERKIERSDKLISEATSVSKEDINGFVDNTIDLNDEKFKSVSEHFVNAAKTAEASTQQTQPASADSVNFASSNNENLSAVDKLRELFHKISNTD